jgi:adenosylcobinamide-GDP ribazoletransferase
MASEDNFTEPAPSAHSDSENGLEGFTPRQLDCFGAAVQFLTRVTVPGMRQMTAEQYAVALRNSVVYFPFVGGCIGVVTAALCLCFSWGLSVWIAALIALGCEALLTGAFHEDAFADTFDALGGGWTRQRVLEIMKDSRLGTYGTLALIVGVGIRTACLAELLERHSWVWACASIIAAAAIGRLAIVAIMVTSSPISDRQSQARDVSGTQTGQTFFIALLTSAPLWIVWLWLGNIQAVLTLTFTMAMLFGYRNYILQRVGGTTGDLLGCSAYFTQLAILVGSTWVGRS